MLASLTLKEAVRRRFYLVSLAATALFFLVSLMPMWFRARGIEVGPRDARASVSVLMVVFMGVPMLKFFSAAEVIGLASGSIGGEIDRGLLAVILPKPLARWQVVTGKWLGINALMALNMTLWTTLLWLSLLIQTHTSYPTLFCAGGVSLLYPVMFSTVCLMFSTFAAPALAAGLSFMLGAAAWPHAILWTIGTHLNVPALVNAGVVTRYIVPMNHVALWVEQVLGPLNPADLNPGGGRLILPLTATHGDLVYVGAYTAVLFLIALAVFQRRDIA